MKILDEISMGLKPDKSVFVTIDKFLKQLNSELKKHRIKATATAGGSIAKGTFLKNDYDVDIFTRFDYSYKNKDISKLLGKVMKRFKAEKIHGSRDYFHINQGDIKFEIVPVLDIIKIHHGFPKKLQGNFWDTKNCKAIFSCLGRKEAQPLAPETRVSVCQRREPSLCVKKPEQVSNVTDMSPLHVLWLKKHMAKNKKLADEIRLAKQFCKANNTYGAESYIKGFSGHVLDILVTYYNGFVNLLKASQKWKENDVIDFHNCHKGKALFNLNKSKISPLIVIDPIMPARNAAAALSKEKFLLFKEKAKEFLKKPDKNFFVRSEITIGELKKKSKGKKLVVLEAEPLKRKEDIAGAKLLKVLDFIRENLKRNSFTLYDSGWQWDKKKNAMFWFILKDEILSEYFERAGPPMHAKEHAANFRKKHKDVFAKGEKLFANVKREHRKAEELVGDMVKSAYVVEKLKKIIKIR